MSSYDEIESVLDSELHGVANLPAIFPSNSIPGEPDPHLSHIWTQFIPTGRQPSARGPNPLMRYDGLYIINVCTPRFIGTQKSRELVELVLTKFGGPFPIGEGGFRVTIPEADREPGFDRDPHYCVPVVVSWYCYAP